MARVAVAAALFLSSVAAFAPVAIQGLRRTAPLTRVNENFGFKFAESQTENTPSIILGEANLKNYVEREIRDDALILGKYNVLERVAELRLLKLTADSGLLSALERKGVTLGDLEALLPVAEELGVIAWLADNLEFAKVFLPLLIEPAPLLLPLLPGLINILPISGGGGNVRVSSELKSGPKKTADGRRILAPGKTVTLSPKIGATGIRVGYATSTSVQDLTGDGEVKFLGSEFLGISKSTAPKKAKKVIKSVGKNAFNTPARRAPKATPVFVPKSAPARPTAAVVKRKSVKVAAVYKQPVAPKTVRKANVAKMSAPVAKPKPFAKPKPVAKAAPVLKKAAPVKKTAPVQKPKPVAKKAAPAPAKKAAPAATKKLLTKPMGAGR